MSMSTGKLVLLFVVLIVIGSRDCYRRGFTNFYLTHLLEETARQREEVTRQREEDCARQRLNYSNMTTSPESLALSETSPSEKEGSVQPRNGKKNGNVSSLVIGPSYFLIIVCNAFLYCVNSNYV